MGASDAILDPLLVDIDAAGMVDRNVVSDPAGISLSGWDLPGMAWQAEHPAAGAEASTPGTYSGTYDSGIVVMERSATILAGALIRKSPI